VQLAVAPAVQVAAPAAQLAVAPPAQIAAPAVQLAVAPAAQIAAPAEQVTPWASRHSLRGSVLGRRLDFDVPASAFSDNSPSLSAIQRAMHALSPGNGSAGVLEALMGRHNVTTEVFNELAAMLAAFDITALNHVISQVGEARRAHEIRGALETST
jgi:hypothetical protein